MPAIRTANPSRLKFILMVVGAVLLLGGFGLAAVGEMRSGKAEVSSSFSCSTSTFGEVLDFDAGDATEDCEQARGDASAGDAMETFGLILLVVGIASIVAAFFVRPALASSTPQVDISEPPVSNDRRPCPECGESIPTAAPKCRFCGVDFRATATAPAAPAAGSSVSPPQVEALPGNKCPECGKTILEGRFPEHMAVAHK